MSEDTSESIQVELRYIRRDLDDIKTKLDKHYVTSEEFKPVKNLVYGVVTLILTSVVVGLITMILR